MATTLALLINRCGLSQREAAEFLSSSPSHIDKASSGKRSTPPGQIAELQELYASIESAAAEAVAAMSGIPAGAAIELGYAADDHEARDLGWPCVGAQRAMLGIVVARLAGREIRLVPRGSTVGTAAAIQAHGL